MERQKIVNFGAIKANHEARKAERQVKGKKPIKEIVLAVASYIGVAATAAAGTLGVTKYVVPKMQKSNTPGSTVDPPVTEVQVPPEAVV